jgi:uncharacterized protein HemY
LLVLTIQANARKKRAIQANASAWIGLIVDNSVDNLLRSLISQLYHKRKETQKLLDSLFSSCDNGRRQPTCESLSKVFLQMIEEVKEVYMVLDALDECCTRKGLLSKGLLPWIRGF